MENLIKQMRVKFPVREENKEEAESTRDRKIPLQKTQSFKERRKGQNWLSRQFSRDMSRDYDSLDGGEYPTAIAAAAFAITSMGESRNPASKKMREEPYTSLTNISKADDGTTPATELQSVSKKFKDANLEVPGKRVSFRIGEGDKTPTTVKRITTLPNKQSEAEYDGTGKPVASITPIKKKATFAEQLDRTFSRKPENAMPKPDSLPTIQPTPVPKPDRLPTILPTPVPKPDRLPTVLPTEISKESAAIPRVGGSKADNWQRSEMAKIQERYEKLQTKILHWENKKKAKAKNKMAMIEGELEKKRARAQQSYREKVKTIEQVAGGARAQAEENRRNEEFKAKEKANKIKSTGKIPSACFCF